jgi:hypothetical protein
MAITGIVLTTVKVFDQATSSSTQVATLYKGNTITASSNTGTWLRLLTRNGAYISGYANSRVGEGMTNGDITWKNDAVVTPPPPPPPPVTTGTAFTLTIAGYKPYTGTLEKL